VPPATPRNASSADSTNTADGARPNPSRRPITARARRLLFTDRYVECMANVDVHLWIGDQDDVVTYTVDVDDGVFDTQKAIDEASERAQADGYDDVNLKEIESAE